MAGCCQDDLRFYLCLHGEHLRDATRQLWLQMLYRPFRSVLPAVGLYPTYLAAAASSTFTQSASLIPQLCTQSGGWLKQVGSKVEAGLR